MEKWKWKNGKMENGKIENWKMEKWKMGNWNMFTAENTYQKVEKEYV